MKFTIALWLVVVNLGNPPTRDEQSKGPSVAPSELFTKSQAVQILGTPVHLTDSVVKNDSLSSSYLCGYKSNMADPKTGKIGAVYFLFENYKGIDGAIKRFSDVYHSNRANGMVKIGNLGDEGAYHTDNHNFDLFMVRKGKHVFNIKINKRTSTSSLKALKSTVKKIIEEI